LAVRRGVVVVFVLIFIAMVVSLGGLLVFSMFVGAPPSVPSNATLHLPIQAPLDEIESVDVFNLLRHRPTLRETTEAIRKAKRDSRVKALVIRPATAGALWGQLQEVRAAVEDFRLSGKPVTAYLEFGGAQEYYLATAADRIVMLPAGQLDLMGLATYEIFFKGALDKLGVYPDLLHIGDFKSASNTFTEEGFTRAHQEMSASLNRDWYNELVRAIADRRKKPEDEVRRIIDQGPFLADQAREAGLIDALAYEDQLDDERPIAGTQRLTMETYGRVPVYDGPRALGSRIALLYASGTIASGASSFDGGFGNVVGSDTFAEWLRKVRVDSSIKAVVVRIDSPGGSAIASEVIWREMQLTREKLPLVVSMGDVAASGGYYIAAPAHAIVAQPGTLTGSIGVVTGKFALGEALEKLGIGTASVADGRHAELYSPFRPFTAPERARVTEQMRATYDLFVSRVAEGRQSTAEKIGVIAQGRVWTGHQARERGLVDELGGLDAAIRLAKERANLDAGKAVDLVVYPRPRSVFDILANPLGTSPTTGVAGLEQALSRDQARALGSAANMLRIFRRGEALLLMPNVFIR
jgi:protease-4